jgi:hypothetical protein
MVKKYYKYETEFNQSFSVAFPEMTDKTTLSGEARKR